MLSLTSCRQRTDRRITGEVDVVALDALVKHLFGEVGSAGHCGRRRWHEGWQPRHPGHDDNGWGIRRKYGH